MAEKTTSASTMFSIAGGISGVASAVSSMFAGRTQAIGFEMQAAAKRVQAKQAISLAKFNNLKLQRNFNETAASQAVAFSAQGRDLSSGSIQNILREDAARLEWDKEYMKMSGEYQNISMVADAAGFDTASDLAREGGVTKGLLTLASTALDFKKVK